MDMATSRTQPPAYAELNALLHTVRCIQQHETQLCTLLEAIKSAGKVAPAVRKELRKLLEEMPSAQAYTTDLEALEHTLAGE